MREQDPFSIAAALPTASAVGRPLDVEIAEGRFFGNRLPIRLRLRFTEQPYESGATLQPIVPLSHATGTRSHVQATPYIAEHGASPQDKSVANGQINGRVLGHAQAWHYPQDRTLVLWECILNEEWRGAGCCACERRDARRRNASPNDANLHQLWRGLEHLLLSAFPTTERIMTPSWEPIYDPGEWQAFLAVRRFRPLTERLYVKEVTSTTGTTGPGDPAARQQAALRPSRARVSALLR